MFKRFLLGALGAILLTASAARADVLVLVHGWASGPETWHFSGTLAPLQAAGWQDGGVLQTGPGGVLFPPGATPRNGNTLYRSRLPAQAPLLVQAGLLSNQLAALQRRHPGERLLLAGHSAGAIVARLALLDRRSPPVAGLVSIAAPNLGTPRAIQGLDVADSKPFFCPGPGIDFLKTVFGGDNYRYLRDSRGALVDLAPNTLTAWLNQQPHPDIAYLAVIHTLAGGSGDELVPAISQDLNQVAALRGRARRVSVAAGHGLTPADGTLLTAFVNGLR